MNSLDILNLSTSSTKMQPYPIYKDSGQDWLGEIPANWDLKRLRFMLSVRPTQTEVKGLSKDTPVSFLPMEFIGDDGTFDHENSKTIGEIGSGYTYFAEGDVTVAKITPCFENGKGALMVGLINGIGYGSTELHVLRPKSRLDKYFLYYLTISHPFRAIGFSYMYGTGGQKRVPEEFIRDFRIGIPSPAEQQSIVAFLDEETNKIDVLIARKEHLISLIRERREALIYQAVANGLNPEAPMRNSEIPWIGSIPKHWQLLHLRRVVSKFVDYRGATPNKTSEGVPLVTAKNIKNGNIDFSLSQEYISESQYVEWMVRGFPEIGDVLVTTEAPLGEVAQITDTGIALAQRIIMLKTNKRVMTNDYLKYYLRSKAGQGALWSRSTGSTAIGIKASHFKEIWVLVPPLEEQRKISAFLDQRIANLDTIIAKNSEQILKLQEYRTALITMAVTGKIDTRSYQRRNGKEPLYKFEANL